MPSASPSLVGLEATSRSVLLYWEPLGLEDQNGIITGYNITITNLDELQANVQSYYMENRSLTISELTPYTTYGLLLTAHTEVGPGPTSDLHTVQTKEEG